jgi:hypothetical protein
MAHPGHALDVSLVPPAVEHTMGSLPPSSSPHAKLVLSTGFVVGLYLDGWAHIRELPESFFTPWHAIIYVSFLTVAGVLGFVAWRARRRRIPWRLALPEGYGLSSVGVAVFMLAGVADLLWHSVFGIETGIEALFSPPHLTLAAGGILIATGPLRGAWHRPQTSVPGLWRAVLSATLLFAVLTFFTSKSHPIVHPWAWERLRPLALDTSDLGLPPSEVGGLGTRELIETLGISGIVIQSAISSALVLLMIRVRKEATAKLVTGTAGKAMNAKGSANEPNPRRHRKWL